MLYLIDNLDKYELLYLLEMPSNFNSWILLQNDTCDSTKLENHVVTTKEEGHVTYQRLTIQNFSVSHTGNYKCVARNHGGIESETRVRIIRPEGKYIIWIVSRDT